MKVKQKITLHAPSKKAKGYTVILAYPDEGYDRLETYMAHTLAESPADAVEHARKRCIKETRCGEWGDPPGSDLEAIAVFKGWLEDVRL